MLATTPTPRPQFIWLIAAIRRDCLTQKPVIHRIPAVSEHEARRTLAGDHLCFFAGRLPVKAVRHV
ncbi:host cell division inhibitor Icd-like protein [Dickeya fangzhongdai]|uniref:host cell division inhibitor Icd-like protein n=1 Tax=Dickeya fangzhongdai TaxID=1778540 RepID=UPI001EFB5423|nr:host cell division inhibitor Icd-like protein [Dickeya fangzhongdai]ULR33272.1 host cell division inhibitor Icd-like protein [Dickeya fangzhongdai]